MKFAIVLVGLLAVGCGEVDSPAATSLDGAAGTSGAAGAAGASGVAGDGQGGATGQAGAGGAPTRSCAIPIDQVNGTATGATWKRSNGCDDIAVQQVQIAGGAPVNFPNAGEWTVESYTPSSSSPTTCAISLRYGLQDATCGHEQLFVTLTVSAI